MVQLIRKPTKGSVRPSGRESRGLTGLPTANGRTGSGPSGSGEKPPVPVGDPITAAADEAHAILAQAHRELGLASAALFKDLRQVRRPADVLAAGVVMDSIKLAEQMVADADGRSRRARLYADSVMHGTAPIERVSSGAAPLAPPVPGVPEHTTLPGLGDTDWGPHVTFEPDDPMPGPAPYFPGPGHRTVANGKIAFAWDMDAEGYLVPPAALPEEPLDELAREAVAALSPLLASRLTLCDLHDDAHAGELRLILHDGGLGGRWTIRIAREGGGRPARVVAAVSSILGPHPVAAAAIERLWVYGAIRSGVVRSASGALRVVGDGDRTKALLCLLACVPTGSRIEVQTDSSAYHALRVGDTGMACTVAPDGSRFVVSWIVSFAKIGTASAVGAARR